MERREDARDEREREKRDVGDDWRHLRVADERRHREAKGAQTEAAGDERDDRGRKQRRVQVHAELRHPDRDEQRDRADPGQEPHRDHRAEVDGRLHGRAAHALQDARSRARGMVKTRLV